MPEIKNLSELITTAQSILILIKDFKSLRDLDALVMLTVYLKSQNKTFQIISMEEVPAYIKKSVKAEKLEILNELKPAEYVISIDYGSSGVEKIVYDTDKAKGKLVFKIVPSSLGFNFDKVEFIEGGSKFDAAITISISDPKEYSDFYDENEYVFKEKPFFAFKNYEDLSDYFSSKSDLPKDVSQLILDRMIKNINVIEGTLEKEQAEKLFSLQSQGADIYSSIYKKYYSNDENYLNLVQQIWSKYYVNSDKKYSYAIITKEELAKLGYNIDFRFTGRIPFNIIKGINVAFLIFQLDENTSYVVIESNIKEISARTVAIVFDGEGDISHATCVLDNVPISELDKRFWPVIKDLYNLEISTKADSVSVDNSDKALTKPRKNSKNKDLHK